MQMDSYIPRKLCRIFAAFSASPGSVNVCANCFPPLANLIPVLLAKAVACMPACTESLTENQEKIDEKQTSLLSTLLEFVEHDCWVSSRCVVKV